VRIVKVPLGVRSYEIKIGTGLLAALGKQCSLLKLGKRCAVISDRNVSKHYAATACKILRNSGFDPLEVTVPAGETAKSLKTVAACYDHLAAGRLERKSFIVALGGGVVGDLAGFVASTYLRGVGFIQIPTTLLAQVDSSVGGKVGVNLKAAKNLVGSFYQPRLVICDLDTFKTLPEREYRSGIAEVIKYGIIYDQALFARVEKFMPEILQRRAEILTNVVARCCEIKAEIVGLDETESGPRALLNFGHTIGHALEAISRYGRYLHGEAISIGQVAASVISSRLCGLGPREVERITSIFQRAGLPTQLNLNRPQRAKLLSAMQLDKKVTDGQVKFVLARSIGKAEFGRSVPEDILNEILSGPATARSFKARP
jgi:3-dehydroquinate synthase